VKRLAKHMTLCSINGGQGASGGDPSKLTCLVSGTGINDMHRDTVL
jgi:hypothetical protein